MKLHKYVVGLLLAGHSLIAAATGSYQLNPGDLLFVSVWNEEALQREVLVLPDGTISFPLVGIVEVSGKTPVRVQGELKQKLSNLIPDPEVNVTVRAVEGNAIFVIGKVNQPGRIKMTSPTDVVQALSLAGGFTPYAKTENIRILRRVGDRQELIDFNYTRITDGQDLKSNILLQSGDTIVVP